ncbi:MAG: Gfo/Idh/MocA family oxidoreductase [Phycisphaerae bacterium]
MKHGVMLIGCGAMARVHCTALKELPCIRLVSAVDMDIERAKAFLAEYGFERTGTDYKTELARDDFDIVLVCTHWPRRFAIIKDCFEAGRHVLSEKPLSVYLDEVEGLVALANKYRRKLRVGMMERFRPMFHKLKELLNGGTIGRPVTINFQHHQSLAPWSYFKNLMAGGVTPNVDCGIHKCDLVRWFLGCDAKSVTSWGAKLQADSPAHNFTHSVFTMQDGTILTLEDCFSPSTEPFIHMWILGTEGRILFEYAGSNERVQFRGVMEDCIHIWYSCSARHETIYLPQFVKAVGPQMEQFVREIEEDQDLTWHYDNVRKATEMVVATVLSEQRQAAVVFPLTVADMTETTRYIAK